MRPELSEIDLSTIGELARIRKEESVLEERLAKMEARSADVSPVVYARVKGDYEARRGELARARPAPEGEGARRVPAPEGRAPRGRAGRAGALAPEGGARIPPGSRGVSRRRVRETGRGLRSAPRGRAPRPRGGAPDPQRVRGRVPLRGGARGRSTAVRTRRAGTAGRRRDPARAAPRRGAVLPGPLPPLPPPPPPAPARAVPPGSWHAEVDALTPDGTAITAPRPLPQAGRFASAQAAPGRPGDGRVRRRAGRSSSPAPGSPSCRATSP